MVLGAKRLGLKIEAKRLGGNHRSLTLLFSILVYTLYVVKGRTVTPLLHKLFLGELHRYYSGYNLVGIPVE